MTRAPAILTLPSAPRLTVVWPLAVAEASSLSMTRKPFRSSLKLPRPPRARLIRPEPAIVPPWPSPAETWLTSMALSARARRTMTSRRLRPVWPSSTRPPSRLARPVRRGSARVPASSPSASILPDTLRSELPSKSHSGLISPWAVNWPRTGRWRLIARWNGLAEASVGRVTSALACRPWLVVLLALMVMVLSRSTPRISAFKARSVRGPRSRAPIRLASNSPVRVGPEPLSVRWASTLPAMSGLIAVRLTPVSWARSVARSPPTSASRSAAPSPTERRRRALVRGPPNRIWAASRVLISVRAMAPPASRASRYSGPDWVSTPEPFSFQRPEGASPRASMVRGRRAIGPAALTAACRTFQAPPTTSSAVRSSWATGPRRAVGDLRRAGDPALSEKGARPNRHHQVGRRRPAAAQRHRPLGLGAAGVDIQV
jgi:hypothetical protein